jgi:hypothetical protein
MNILRDFLRMPMKNMMVASCQQISKCLNIGGIPKARSQRTIRLRNVGIAKAWDGLAQGRKKRGGSILTLSDALVRTASGYRRRLGLGTIDASTMGLKGSDEMRYLQKPRAERQALYPLRGYQAPEEVRQKPLQGPGVCELSEAGYAGGEGEEGELVEGGLIMGWKKGMTKPFYVLIQDMLTFSKGAIAYPLPNADGELYFEIEDDRSESIMLQAAMVEESPEWFLELAHTDLLSKYDFVQKQIQLIDQADVMGKYNLDPEEFEDAYWSGLYLNVLERLIKTQILKEEAED